MALSSLPEYKVWKEIRRRCRPGTDRSKYWGDRGLRVEYSSFQQFYDDVGPKPEGYSIERIDNDRGYAPGNCKWIPFNHQQKNMRYCLKPEDYYLALYLLQFLGHNETQRFTGISKGSLCNIIKRKCH